MKNLIYSFLLILPLCVKAQQNEGKIIYSETAKLELEIPEEHREQLKGVIPESRTSTKVLFFNAQESIYKNQEKQDDDVVESGSESGGMHFKMVISRPDNQLYKNIAKNEVYEKQEFMGRTFLITDETKPFQWKLANEQKEIAGYVCQKATIDDADHKAEAWFSPQIPVPSGPMQYGQLPGMILELNIGEGQTLIVATEVSLMPLDKDEIKAPDKGKKVSREEYDKIVEEKQKEMEELGGNRMIIKTRRN